METSNVNIEISMSRVKLKCSSCFNLNKSGFHNYCGPFSIYVNIIYKSIKSRFNYILKIIQIIKYRIDEANVKGSVILFAPF